MKEFELWLEGFAITGQNSTAKLQGTEFGENFEEAMKTYAKKYASLNIEERDGNFFIWGCQFYDNEYDARKYFG